VTAIPNVFEKMRDHRWRDEKAGVFEPGRALKSNTDNAVILNDGAATISGIDRGIGLNAEELAIADMRVGLHLNPRNNPARVGNLFATSGITVSDDRRAHFGEVAEFELIQAVEKAFVLDGEDSQI